MTKNFDRSIFIAEFKEDTKEHLARLEKNILSLEKNPKDRKLIEDMMREAHTLKGSATMMGYKRIVDLTHKFEDALSRIKEGSIAPKDLHFELLFKVLDTIKSLLEDKVAWPDKGIAYPAVVELEKKIDEAFKITAAKAPKEIVKAEEEIIEDRKAEPVKPQAAVEERGESIRVNVKKLKDLMSLAGELVIVKIKFEQRQTDLDGFLSKIQELNTKLFQMREKGLPVELASELNKKFNHILEEFSRTADELNFVSSQLQDSVMGVRMLPLETTFQIFPRMVRDLSKEENKLIEFKVSGQEVELDKVVIEKIQDPLIHLLRNAVNHGIESPQERKGLGKPEAGRIDLRAYYKGSQVVIEVEDDGKGVDADKLKEAALKKGLLNEDEAKRMSNNQALYLLSSPGLTTETEVSKVSGRGVGLDVVKTNVTELKGLIEISSEPGKGTKFTIKLPLTLAITLALFIKARNETFTIPLDNIVETLRITPAEIKRVEKREAISVRDEIIPLIRLGDVLGLARQGAQEKTHIPVVIVGLAEKKLAILVDELVGKQELVVKDLGDHLKKVSHIAGATVLGTGEAVLILDIFSLILGASGLSGLVKPSIGGEDKKELKHAILVVDDSLITRDLEKSMLEAAGYKVETARDGAEALKKLAEERFEVVLTDISMPGMDGIEMLNRMRKDKRFSEIPVVVVSAKESEEDKKRGLEAGANAYMAKSQFDQTNLLAAIERLIK